MPFSLATRTWWRGVGVGALLGCLWGGPAWAGQSPAIADIVITNNSADLLVFSTLRGALEGEWGEALQSGNPVSFAHRIELLRSRPFWPDQGVASKVVKRTVRFDALQNEYIYASTQDGESPRERRTRSADEVRLWMTELNGVSLGVPGDPVPGGQYYVRIKADLIPPKFIFPLNYLLFFWNRSTGWTYSPLFTLGSP